MRDRPLTIISGGQTGADRAALDVARALGLPYGGAVPKGRAAEDGPIPDRYGNLVETKTADPAERTRRNVLQSDATLLVTHGEPRGGSALTRDVARAEGRPFLHVDLRRTSAPDAQRLIRAWLQATPCRVLNVAGPRASEDPDIYRATFALLHAVLGDADA
ncbi:MAG: putative molybdenum carrier protein [Acetobacteraceae bacterium]|nr:putative molybdenum carrier protein [Acetobacteraceae bacterium]